MTRTRLVASAMARPLLEPRLPDWVEPHWFMSVEELMALAPTAEIGWFDLYDKGAMASAIRAATALRWLNSIYAGVDGMPLDLMRERGITFTNGTGINAITIAEYVLMGMLTIAKGYDDVLRARDQHEWLEQSPGIAELAGSRALIIGMGAIGTLVKARLEAFDVDVTTVRRTPAPGCLTPDQWRGELGSFDWVILAVPATAETEGMIGTDELAAMKPGSAIINIARGSVIVTDALVAALRSGPLAHAFLDVTDPEPLPADHPLWTLPNAHISMHLSGKAQNRMFPRSIDRFIDNLARWHRGEPVEPQVDLSRGY